MPVITIQSDGVLEAVSAKLAAAADWLPAIYDIHLPALGRAVEEVMANVIEPNRYTGSLAESIISDYDPGLAEVAIYPTADHNGYDGGAILEEGTGPHTPPWAPIAAWAEFRGLPAFPIWWGIVEHGTAAHPFLKRTLDDARTRSAMDEAVLRIAVDAALEIATQGSATAAGFTIAADAAPAVA